jgi:hypothetical protein
MIIKHMAALMMMLTTSVMIASSNESSYLSRCIQEISSAPAPRPLCCTGNNGYFRDIVVSQDLTAHTVHTTDLFVSGTTLVDITITVTSVSLVGDLTVTGSLIVGGGGVILGDWTVTNDLSVTGSTVILGDGCVLGNFCVQGDLSVNGSAVFQDSVFVSGDLCVSDSFCSSSMVVDNLIVTASANVSVPISVVVDAIVEELFTPTTDFTVTRSVIVDDGGLFVGDVTIGNNLLLTGSICVEQLFKGVNGSSAELQVQDIYSQLYEQLDRHSLMNACREIWDTLGHEYVITTTVPAGQLGQAVAISAQGDVIAVASNNSLAIYTRTYATNGVSSWVQSQLIVGANEFGFSVALSANGKQLAVGAPGTAGNNGALFLYAYDEASATWILVQTITGSVVGERFGSAVALSAAGDSVAVGAPLNGFSNTGSVYLFNRIRNCSNSSSAFALQQQVTPAVQVSGISFGSAVALSADGRFMLVGAPLYTDTAVSQGAAYFFGENKQYIWTQKQGPVVSTAPIINGLFGASVSMANGGWYAVIGEPGNNAITACGKRHESLWDIQAIIVPQLPGNSGCSVSLSDDGTVLAIGENSANGTKGRVTLVTRFDTVWATAYTLSPTALLAGDAFGSSVQISRDGSFCTVGAPLRDSSAGTAYAYSPANNSIPTDLTISGSTCVQSDMIVDGDLFVTGTIVYGTTLNNVVVSACTVSPSDVRIKHSIEPLQCARALQMLKKLEPVMFQWHHPELHKESGPQPVGFIAQDVEQVMEHWVKTVPSSGAEEPYMQQGEDEKVLAIAPDIYAYLVATLQGIIARTEHLESQLVGEGMLIP